MKEKFSIPQELVVKYFSDRAGKEVEINIDDIPDIYASSSLNNQEADAAKKVIDRIKRVCLSDRLGTFDFCLSASESLVQLNAELRDRSLRIRKSVSKRYSGGGRQSDTGAQFRGQILIELEDAIKDVSTMANMLKQ